MQNRNYYLLALLLLPVLLLGGCWNIKDINKRFFPLIIAVSKEDDETYKVTLQIPIPQNVSESSRIVTVEDKSVASALGHIQTNSEDVMDYSQTQLIFVHSSLANDQAAMQDLIHFIMRANEIPSRALVAITDDTIEDLLTNINEKLGTQTSSVYDYFNKGYDWAPEIFSVPIWKAYQSLFIYTKDLAIPVVRAGKDTVFEFDGVDIFKKGEKVARISPLEGLLINMLQDRGESGEIEGLESSSVIITGSTLKNKVTIKNKQPSIAVDLHLKIRILEKQQHLTNKQIQRQLEKRVEQRFYKVFNQLQEKQTDAFGFGQHFRGSIPYAELKNWREAYYSHLKVHFNVHTTVE
ncbi:Ger(x)C family spore germination protein [Metasolibacillus meyeri]|uniref:Ger(x)C family spore germination protein n=1 Tax=Metasolibacillus meyeri TaxID=1071052 RepID=UPI00187D1445|nr:Ger(x)C family spore germination protein [Metasolibacillus meyeri]